MSALPVEMQREYIAKAGGTGIWLTRDGGLLFLSAAMAFACATREMMVGAKKRASSSGCAVNSKIRCGVDTKASFEAGTLKTLFEDNG